MEKFREFTDCHFSLARSEKSIEKKLASLDKLMVAPEDCCIQLADLIVHVFATVGDAYDSNPEQMSLLILNLFDLWVQMDNCAINICPLLCDYALLFKPELLDVLQVPTLLGMERLQNVQHHLQTRNSTCRFALKTIFSGPGRNCFATRYVEQDKPLRKLRQQIERAFRTSCRKKTFEWNRDCGLDNTCVCNIKGDRPRSISKCQDCRQRRRWNRVTIAIHEDFLPEDGAHQAAIILQPGIPPFLAAYRNATFRILRKLGRPSNARTSSPPVMLLKNYSQLQCYMRSTMDGVSLAPPKESFAQIHEQISTIKVDISDVLFPLGLEFAYYDTKSGVVRYNFIERHLLVDGNPLGSLPRSIRDSATFKELFGNQRPLAFPSSLNSMSHVMATNIHGNEIHFGFRGTRVVIRALDRFCLLGYIPRRVFIDGNNFDLPSALTKNCAHWLNILAKRLEIRHQPIIWETRQSDWIVNVSNRRAQRGQDVLVDPHSDLCKRINNIFCYFVNPERLIVYQPAIGTLSVNMPRLGLYFFVNKNNLLECPGVAAEMDPNQDTGTLYGFLSKIVLRNIASHELRRIVTPLEKLIHMCYGMHVAVRVRKTTGYAQLHAFTSFVLPDPLTGRAGAEEALHILRSEDCQPLMPMTSNLTSILRAISKLSPSREYYPNDERRLQTVTWSERLTANIQNDSYEGLVQEILAESDRLQFSLVDDNEATDIDIEDLSYLRRHEMDRSICPKLPLVYQTVGLVCKRPFRAHMTRSLATILQDWESIGGFYHVNADSESISSRLSDLMENNIGEQWGSLVDLCRHTDLEGLYKLVFRLALLSFGTKPNMDAIRSLAALDCLDELKVLQPPTSPWFAKFEFSISSPTLEPLLSFIAVDYPIAEPDAGNSQTEQDRCQEQHRILCEAEGRRLAFFLLEQ
ncbi:hypothetical protein B7494_g926 [Chlorociboria aeruginascens]|nr:hypothetical protein B7494_g926 [Chlorociboria aeruginascens]